MGSDAWQLVAIVASVVIGERGEVMRRFAAKILFVSLVVAMSIRGICRGAQPPASYQYPLPGQQGGPPVLCTTCVGPTHNLPTWLVPPQLKFIGRYMDGGMARDAQAPIRTYRARDGAAVVVRNKLYMMFGGSTFASWQLSTFAAPSTTMLQQYSGPDQCCPVLYRPLQSSFNVDQEWQTIVVDGQNRIGGFDWDDRGYIYVASGPYGWGIVREDGNGMGLVMQVTNAGLVAANNMGLVKANGKYYALVMSGGSDQTGVSNVTVPGAPSLPSYIDHSPAALTHYWGQIPSEDVVAIAGQTVIPYKLEIYKASEYVGNAPAGKSFTSDIQPWWEAEFGDDGTLYTERGITAGMFIDVMTAPAGTLNYNTIQSVSLGKGNPGVIRTGGGYLTLTSRDGNNAFDVRLFRIGADRKLTEIDIGHFFQRYYVLPPAGYAKPNGNTSAPTSCVPYKIGTHVYLVYFGYGMGDIYEIVDQAPVPVACSALDPDGDGKLTMRDVFTVIGYVFAHGPAPAGNADADGDGKVDGNDVSRLQSCVLAR